MMMKTSHRKRSMAFFLSDVSIFIRRDVDKDRSENIFLSEKIKIHLTY